MGLVWVLHGKESRREASQILTWSVGGPGDVGY